MTDFFEQFPRFLTQVAQKPTIMTDIFRRIAVGSRFNDVSVVLVPYLVRDGETPEMVSNKIYGTPFYHWVVLHSNNIVNTLTEWPLEDRYVTFNIFEKYDFTILVDNPLLYEVGDTITSSDGGEFIVTRINSTTIQLRSTGGMTYLTTSSILTITTTDRELTGLRVNAVDDPMEHIHHYIDTITGYELDEFNIAGNENIQAVTNYEYELAVNDAKREIRLLDPQYIGDFVRTFEGLVTS